MSWLPHKFGSKKIWCLFFTDFPFLYILKSLQSNYFIITQFIHKNKYMNILQSQLYITFYIIGIYATDNIQY